MRFLFSIMLAMLLALLSGCRSRPDEVDYNQWKEALKTRSATAARHVTALPGFEVDLLRTATKTEGSWVSLEFDDQGRLLIGREGPGILRLTLPRWRFGQAKVEIVNNELKECRGLLWAYGGLYANANNSKGLYRLRDTNNNDQFDEVTLLRKTAGGVGHGRNSIALGPDGYIYLTHGNDVLLPNGFQHGPNSPYRNYRRDQLLPCDWNRVLFNQGVQPPAGHIIRTDRDGQRWEMVAGGFRNPYGLAFHPDGELFVYDADMEWDVGTPWYRPTRINHVVSGGEYGWRQGTDKWPAYFPDSLPSNGDIGLGSPTAIAFGSGSHFPAPYREALFILDWAYGKIIAVHLSRKGASYYGQAEEFITGRPLNVTGMDFGPDGAMYFVTGGRRTQSGLYRVRYTGNESTSFGQEVAVEAERARSLRRSLEQFQINQSIEGVGLAWEHLGSDDPWIRYAARVALENQSLAQWQLPALTESDTKKALTALLALARVGEAGVQSQLFARLNDLPWESLGADWQLLALRAYQIGFTRMGKGQSDARKAIVNKIVVTSEESAELRMEVSRLLIFLQEPGIIPGLLNYVVDAESPEERLFYLFHMRHIADGWTPGHRRAYFAWLKKMTQSGGVPQLQLSYKYIIADALAKVPPGERERYEVMFERKKQLTSSESERLAKRKVIEEWTMADFDEIDKSLAKRDLVNGRRVLKAAACLACHRFGDEGVFLGPDLTEVGSRFDSRTILESILEPSKVIDDKYRNVAVTTRKGELIMGRIVAEKDNSILLASNPYQPALTREIDRRTIASRKDSGFSPMPVGLLNSFSRNDIIDLLSLLETGGGTTP